MLEKIKSIFFLKKVFSEIDERIVLKIIKYNKKIQNKMDIDLINYKIFSGKYIIYGENGIGTEYDALTHDRLFEGEYSKGERNGKGKEYYDDNILKFEGEYLNGKRNGKGKEYYYNTGAIEIKYLNGIKEYNIKSLIKFEGDYLNGKEWNGKGYDGNNNIVYELKNGKGYKKQYDSPNHLIYEGEYINREINGKGREYGNNYIFEGEFLNGKNGMEK